MNPDAKCEDCRYWKGFETARWKGFGECRFNAPQIVRGKISDANQFPLTNPDDWCGKFESKTQTQESTGPK